jgi:hypothetical protein
VHSLVQRDKTNEADLIKYGATHLKKGYPLPLTQSGYRVEPSSYAGQKDFAGNKLGDDDGLGQVHGYPWRKEGTFDPHAIDDQGPDYTGNPGDPEDFFGSAVTKGDGFRCHHGYYGDGNRCEECMVCDPHAERFNPCLSGTLVDTSSCTCAPLYYGQCSTNCTVGKCFPCTVCDAHATNVGRACGLGWQSDTVVCKCNVHYYGDGVSCQPCRYSSCHFHATLTECPLGADADNSSCVCNEGYYGDGLQCHPCRQCGPDATQAGECLPGSNAEDSVACTCNAGFWGDGVTCTPCRSCSAHATSSDDCAAGSSADTVTCTCNEGKFGREGATERRLDITAVCRHGCCRAAK